MTQLLRIDAAALNKALIGFDALFNDYEKRYANQIQNNYPPHNVIRYDEDNYEIQLAVTGFDLDEVSVRVEQDLLFIEGHRKEVNAIEPEYLYRGLATRDFTRVFPLSQFMEVGEGTVKNGVLKISIKRIIPDTMKPRFLNIKAIK
jgi:molecular chaperone IbpA